VSVRPNGFEIEVVFAGRPRPWEGPQDRSREVLSTSTGRPTRISWLVGSSGTPHRRLPRIRTPCGDRPLQREPARTAPIAERRHADRRSAQPSSMAMMAGDVRRVQERLRLPEGGPPARPDADRLRALHARDAPLNNVYRQRTAGVADDSSGDIGSYFGL
jgi:hypothetical protein